MVTRIQVGTLTTLPGVPGLGELANEETLPRTYFRPPGDSTRVPSALLERKSPFRSPVRLLPLPRFAPRPFSRDQAPDMKSPVTSWGPSRPDPPCGHPQDGTGEKLADSVGQYVGSGDRLRRSSTSAFSKAEFLQLSPATTVVLDTTKAGPALGKGVREGAPKVNMGSTLETHLGSRPEVAVKPAVPARKPAGPLPRPASLPQDIGPAVTAETSPKEPLTQASSVDGSGSPALDPRPRLKRRPVSAIYMESIQPQKPVPGGAASAGKTPPTPPEKTWVRRPRPLSMDLTARFEVREAVLRKGAEEAPATAQRQGPERVQPEPRVDSERRVQAEAQHQEPERVQLEPRVDSERRVQAGAPRDTNFLEVTPKTPERKEKVFLRQAETGSLRAAGATVDTPTRDQLDREQGQAPQPPFPRPGKGPDAAEVKSRAANQETGAPGESGSRGSLRKRISLMEGESPTVPAVAAASEPPPTSPGLLSEVPGPGGVGVSVQDRIKGWTGESPEPKLERRRKMLQARPLSVDLTRLFSSAAARPEVRYEKCSEPRDQLPQEPRGKKEGHVSDAVTSPRSPWKPGASGEKLQLPERKDASSQIPDRCPGDGSVAAPNPATITPEADGGFQTVRATLFEHRVERHTVTTASVADGPLSGPRPKPRPEKGSWLGKDPLENTPSKPEACRWLQSPDTEKSAWSACSHGEPSPQHSCLPEKSPLRTNGQKYGLARLQHPEHLPTAQKVQPLVDVVPAVGERAHSQAVPVAPEETAVTLRNSSSRHWPKGGQQLLENPPGHPEGRSEGQGLGQRASLIWEVRGAPHVSGPKADSQEPKNNCPSPRWTRATAWHQASTGANAEDDPEQSPDVARPRDPGVPSVSTQSSVAEDSHEGRRGAGHWTGERSPSWGRPADAPSWGRDASSDWRVRPGAEAMVLVQKVDGSGSAGVGAAQVGEAQRVQAPEPQVRMRRAGPSDQRMDRWRRRTLPHDVRFEEFGFLAPEPCWKVEQRRSDLPVNPTAAFRDPPLAHKTEGRSPGGSQDRALAPRKPASPAEPKATFFAVTYQIPNAQKAKSTKPEAPCLTEPSRTIAPPPSPHLTSPLLSVDRDEAPEPKSNKNWTKGRGHGSMSLSKSRVPASAHVPSGGDKPPGPCREAEEAGALWAQRGSDEHPSFQNDRKDGGSRSALGGAPQQNPAFRSPKASDLSPRATEGISETLPGRTKDGYRSSVLDIDALMEEYRKQPARGPWEALEGPSAQGSRYFPEKPGQQGGPEGTRRSLKEGREAEGLWKQASLVETNHTSTPSHASYPGVAPNPKGNALLWTVPPSSPCEKYPGASTGPERPGNSVTGPSEDEKRAVASKHHGGTKSQNSPTESNPEARVDLGRKSSRNGEGRGAGLWGASPPHRGRSLLDVKRTHSEKGAPAQVREGLSILQDARERRREQPPGGSEARETRRGPCLQDSGPHGSQKVWPLGEQEQHPQQASPVTVSPRRSHSFCRDKRSGPLVDQLKQCFSRRAPEAKDTDTLVQEADSQYGTWTGQRQSGDSLAPQSPSPDGSTASAHKQPPSSHLSSPSSLTEPSSAGDSAREQRSASVDRSSAGPDSPDGTDAPPPLDADATKPVDDFAFINQTSVLDSSALKTRVQLSKRSRRRAPTSHAARRSRLSRADTLEPWEEVSDSVWMFKDSTEEKPPQREESDEEEKPPRTERTPVGHTPRTPAFPGVDPAMLKAQLHKRPETDSPSDTSSWAPQPKTPKSPFQPGVLGSRVLPSSMEKDDRSDAASPLWLKELKSKKRQSLYENQA